MESPVLLLWSHPENSHQSAATIEIPECANYDVFVVTTNYHGTDSDVGLVTSQIVFKNMSAELMSTNYEITYTSRRSCLITDEGVTFSIGHYDHADGDTTSAYYCVPTGIYGIKEMFIN